VELLKAGMVGVIPTDTVYGLVASASLPKAVSRLYAIKGRSQKPGTLLAANIDQLIDLGFKRRYLKAVEDFWPNPLSIILPCPELVYLHFGLQTLPVRIPADNQLLSLLEKAGPLQTTSANIPGKPVVNTISQAQEIFAEKVGFYVDGGDLSNRGSSTIIEINDDAITIIRPGACKIDEKGRIAK
jgi:tRNA threonylcarbamoyl adenosine modification protein (Sua5/YciO/YrdC/YwlC family)